MFIPDTYKTLIKSTFDRIIENEKEVPPEDRLIEPSVCEEIQDWIAEHSSIIPWDTSKPVETHCTNVSPGDLFRPNDAGENTEWRLYLGGEMSPHESWDFAMAYADRDTGIFEGIHFTHDSNNVEIVGACKVCEDNQAVRSAEVKVEGEVIHTPVCEECYTKYSTE